MSFNSRPHKEVDAAALWISARLHPFNSRPHKEVDREDLSTRLLSYPFNSRPHKEVDLQDGARFSSSKIFQFTTSQGGRHMWVIYAVARLILSIHDLTRRSTPVLAKEFRDFETFNSRPHKEVDRKAC